MNIRKPIILALLYLSGNKIPRNLKEIKKVRGLSEKDIKKYQEEKLKKLLLYACSNVPYYNKVLKEKGVVKDNNVYLENFKKIPILTKEIIRKEGKNLYSKEKRVGVYENTSGGSTGEPVRFLQDKNYDEWNKANKIWYKHNAGQEIGEKELRFWGSERDLLEGKESFKIRFRNWMYNRKEFNTFKMSEKEMYNYVDEWNKYNPSWVECYVQSIYEFAKFIEKNNLKIKSPKNGILTSAGTLYPEMKKTIERVFRCPVYNRYGSREVGDMACGTDKLKISFWNQKIEIINKKVYVTNLNNFSMPLIRYDIGDLAEFGKNDFELKRIMGRVNSMIRTSKGMVDSTAITSALYFDLENKLFTSFSKYQLIQKKENEFELNIIVSNLKKWKKDKETILEVMQKILGKDIIFKFKEVKKIASSKNGKYEYIRSEVK
jgi:phenylacetate-CoA ligase